MQRERAASRQKSGWRKKAGRAARQVMSSAWDAAHCCSLYLRCTTAAVDGYDFADFAEGFDSTRGSDTAKTFCACTARYLRMAWRNSGCFAPSMAVAKSAALTAPGLPMASVPTGMPPGICTVDRSESRPLSEGDSMGTPRTGRTVFAAVTPARRSEERRVGKECRAGWAAGE